MDIIIVIVVIPFWLLITNALFSASFQDNIRKNTGKTCRFKKNRYEKNIIKKFLKFNYISSISKWLYNLYLVHLISVLGVVIAGFILTLFNVEILREMIALFAILESIIIIFICIKSMYFK